MLLMQIFIFVNGDKSKLRPGHYMIANQKNEANV